MSYTGFKNLGKNRYKNAVVELRKVTGDIFTKSAGFDLRDSSKWSDAQKKKVRRYWREYDHLTARPYDIVRVKDPKKLKAVQKAALQQKYIGKFNVALVPGDSVNKPKITFNKNNEVIITHGKIKKRVIQVSAYDLATDVDSVVAAVLAKTPGAKAYRIQCGQYEFTRATFTAGNLLAREIKRMQMKYGNWQDWLNGVVAYYYDNYKNLDEFTVKVAKAREKLLDSRRATRAKIQRKEAKERFDKTYGEQLRREVIRKLVAKNAEVLQAELDRQNKKKANAKKRLTKKK